MQNWLAIASGAAPPRAVLVAGMMSPYPTVVKVMKL
jgi:hypothetical protein